ncbi:alkaline phosphatase D family protein [Pelomonas sp. CA6]|uniref:alkaline phosphatase D family protein n=1 Tax=Pelomonas sp. CA6 TaxID=2907999 RepID=UPI001F4C2C87|nr:alkaline phosphatase D family protein [Pelomonas sp. CA6]MCH7345656.1 alkaline phosphatase D family protein [Pelomonas sp. CA6]
MSNLSRRHLLQASLAAGLAPALLSQARAASDDPFTLGLASGCPLPDRLVLWTRLTGEALPEQVPVRWELAEDEGFQRVVARGEESASAAQAHSVHAEPQGLRPDRWYWYRFSALGARSATGRTRTAPAADAPVQRLRFAIASCQRWDHGRYAAWADMAQQDPDLVLFLGDYIYEYATAAKSEAARRHAGGPCRTLADYRARYAQYKSDPQLQAMHARAPWIYTWDDHEVENDYAGEQGQDLAPDFAQRRAAAYQAYWEHMPFPKSWQPRDGQMRLYTRYDWGRLARVITLDDRQYRDPQACPRPGRGGGNTVTAQSCPALRDPRRSLLGATQEAWLARQWDDERGWNLLAQQTLMAGMSWQDRGKDGGMFWTEGWDGYAASRERLLRGLSAAGARNPVVLGGDVHANYVADLRLDPDRAEGPVLASEFCGTSISSLGLDRARVDAALPHNPQLHYARPDQRGYMLFDLQQSRLDVRLQVVEDPWRADSAVHTAARFAVEAGRPGPQKA